MSRADATRGARLAVSTVIFAVAPGVADGDAADVGATERGAIERGSTERGATRGDATRAEATRTDATRTDATERPSLRVPLVRRLREPGLGAWALPGGWLPVDESLDGAAARTLAETTGLAPGYLEQLYTFGAPDRSPGERVVSVVYWALVHAEEVERAVSDENVRWFDEDALPPLAFDHAAIIDYALTRLRTKLQYSRIAHELLGDTFTMAELRGVHEAVLRRRLDPANFRRTMESSGTLVDTGRRLAGTRHRPPALYRFNAADATAEPVVGPLPITVPKNDPILPHPRMRT